MSAQVLTQPAVAMRGGSMSPLVVLGLKEAKRILLSPAYLLLLGFFILTGGIEGVVEGASMFLDAEAVYSVVLYFSSLYLGLITYVAAHLVTSSARRTHAEQQLSSSPVDERGRGLGLCVGVVCGPFVFGALLMTLLGFIGAASPLISPDGVDPLSVAELSQVAITFAGAGLFGVVWATWLRFPGSLILGLIALVFGTMAIIGSGDVSNVSPWFAPHLTATSWLDAPWTSMGSQAWHAVYLVGLCLLGVCAVALKQREGRRTWLAISAGALLFTALAGALQV